MISAETRQEMIDVMSEDPIYHDPPLAGDPVYGCDVKTALAQLLAADVVFPNSRVYLQENGEKAEETIVLFINCNDLFYWGCADAECFTYEEVAAVWEAWRDERLSRWVCLRRKMRPQTPIEKEWREEGRWDEALEALPVRSPEDCG